MKSKFANNRELKRNISLGKKLIKNTPNAENANVLSAYCLALEEIVLLRKEIRKLKNPIGIKNLKKFIKKLPPLPKKVETKLSDESIELILNQINE